MSPEQIQAIKVHLLANPGASLPAVLEAVYGRTEATVHEVLAICRASRAHGFGAAANALWYLAGDNAEIMEAHLNNRHSPAVAHALPMLLAMQGEQLIDFAHIDAIKPVRSALAR